MGINAFLKPEDLADRTSITPGWYPAEIIKYEETVTKGTPEKPSDGSNNAVFHFRLIDGPFKGRELRRYFNEKYLGMGKNLWAVLFGLDKAKGGNLSSEMFESSVGKQLKVYVKKDDRGKYDSIEDFQPKDW